MQLHLWCPDVFGFKGGIQVFSGYFLEALKELYPDSTCNVVVKHDRRKMVASPQWPHTHFHFSGNWPRRLRTWAFAEQLLRLGLWQQPDLVITTHLHFAVAAYTLK